MEIKNSVQAPNNFTEEEWIHIKRHVMQTTGQIIYSEEELKSLGREATKIVELQHKASHFSSDEDDRHKYLYKKKQREKKERENTHILDRRRKNIIEYESMPITS